MNKTILVGRVTKDVEVKVTNDLSIARFSLPIPRAYKKDETDFINCVVFGKLANTFGQYVKKGQQIALTGNIRTGSYDAQDGTKRYTTDVVVETFEFIGNKPSNNNVVSDVVDPSDIPDLDADLTQVDDGDMPF